MQRQLQPWCARARGRDSMLTPSRCTALVMSADCIGKADEARADTGCPSTGSAS